MTKTETSNLHKLALFDVDGTLLFSGGAGKRAMVAAFRDVFGIDDGFAGMHMYGRTDPEIVRHALANHRLDWQNEKIAAFKRRYLELITSEMALTSSTKKLMPGIPQVLERLHGMPNVTLGLLTGNWRESALVKLTHFNLVKYFEIGAFADDSEIRKELLPYAVARYRQKTAHNIDPQNIYVIGDTPRDIQCARPHGATTVAVATGWNSLEQLAEEQPDYLFKDLSDSEAFLKIFF